MSTAAMNGAADGMKSPTPNAAGSSSKQQFKGGAAGKSMDGGRKQTASPVDGQNRNKQQAPQQKAWQGTNPITQRASIPNGTEKPLPKLPPQAQAKNGTESHVDKHAHDRLLYIMANFQGMDTLLTLKSGEQYSGVFTGGAFDSPAKSRYVLKMAKRARLPNDHQVNGDADVSDEYLGEGEDHVMAFDVQDTVDLEVKNVVTAGAQPMQNGSTASTFRTDAEISGREPSMPRERELQRWQPDTDPTMDMSLEDSGERGWDQFAENERLYGVQSSYDENIYTTSIDRSNPQYRQREAAAARIAREMGETTPANAHVAEERRMDANNEEGLDEEEKYSGVRREAPVPLPKRGTGSYIPPSQRPLTNAPTVPGAPFDPAIISLAKPAPPAAAAAAAAAEPAAPVAEPSAPVELPKLSATETASRDTSVPAAVIQTPKSQADQPPEDTMRKTADAFKQFANMEKLKVRAAQEQKRAGVKHEKNIKLNDLKKFAANFKLNSRVPDDLVPILAKDSKKQKEIQDKAAEAAKEAEVRAKEKKEKEVTPGATPPAPSSATSQASAAGPPASDSRLPFNHRARPSQQMRTPQLMQGQGQSPRAPMSQRAQQTNQLYGGRGGIQPVQPLPDNIRIPTGPAIPSSSDRAPLSPSSATSRFNINAMEFRPSAPNFTPSGTTPSPQRKASNTAVTEPAPAQEPSASFFGKDKKPVDPKDRKDIESSFNPIKRMLEEHKNDKQWAPNGGIPPPFRTPPTWPGDENRSYKDSFPKNLGHSSQGVSPMHTPNPNVTPGGPGGQMPHAHQLPAHMQQGPQQMTPHQRPQYYQQQSSHGPPPGAYDPRLQQMQQFGPQFGPNGSVQNSPRFGPAQMAPFTGQMPAQMHMGQYNGHGMPMQTPYGVSPSLQPRQVHMPVGPNGPGAGMMMPGGPMGGGQFGQMPQGRHVFPPGGPQFPGQQQMGGHMMVPNPSGGYPNGPMQQQVFPSPGPQHAQPHFQHAGMPGHGTPGPGGYTGSPRPPMMQHGSSHQGFNPNQQHTQPGMNMHGGMQGGGPGMQGQGGPMPFTSSPGQPHPMHWQGRQLSSGGMQGYPQMTPRQQHAQAVQHPSPGMGGPPTGPSQGEEAKGG